MDVIWSDRGPQTVNDVHAGLGRQSQQLAYSTVKAVLANLVAKGHLRRDSERRSHTFSAVESREAFQQRTVAHVVDSLIKDYRQPLMAHLAGRFAADESSFAEIERLIDKKKAERRR